MEYIAYMHKDPQSDFGVSFPNFPGCITTGETVEEAQRLAAEGAATDLDGTGSGDSTDSKGDLHG